MWENDYLDKSLKNNLQRISLQCTLKPSVSILTVQEAKNYIKVSHSNDDVLIPLLIKNTTNTIETVIHKVIHKSGFTQKQQGGCNNIKLMKCPVIGTPTITYYESFDSTGTVLSLNTDYRIVDNILYNSDNYFTEGRDGDGYKIDYEAGLFTNGTDDNSMEYAVIKNVMLRLTAFLYENRQQYCTQFNEENWSINYDLTSIPIEIKSMLIPLRQPNLGVL
jgi:hypothetical protein